MGSDPKGGVFSIRKRRLRCPTPRIRTLERHNEEGEGESKTPKSSRAQRDRYRPLPKALLLINNNSSVYSGLALKENLKGLTHLKKQGDRPRGNIENQDNSEK